MIRAGVNLIPEAPVGEIVALAVEAERLGFQRCWVYDEGLATRDVYVVLAAIAQATSTIEIGTGITNPYTRHAATTANAIATLDELSGGRAFLGIGAGGSLTLDPLAIDRSRSLSAVRDTLLACRRLFSGQKVDLESATVTLRGAHLALGRPNQEIWLAGRGPRMLRLGGELADGVMLDFIHRDTLGDYVALVHEGARASGNKPRLCYSTMVITDERAMAETKPHMTYRLVDSPPRVRELLGITDIDIERIRAAMGGGLRAAAAYVRDEWVLPFVISGSIETCARELSTLMRDHSFDEFLLPVLELDGAVDLLRTVADVAAHA